MWVQVLERLGRSVSQLLSARGRNCCDRSASPIGCHPGSSSPWTTPSQPSSPHTCSLQPVRPRARGVSRRLPDATPVTLLPSSSGSGRPNGRTLSAALTGWLSRRKADGVEEDLHFRRARVKKHLWPSLRAFWALCQGLGLQRRGPCRRLGRSGAGPHRCVQHGDGAWEAPERF